MTATDTADEPPLAEWAAEWAGRPIWVPWALLNERARLSKCPARTFGKSVVRQPVEKLRTTLGQAEELAAELPADIRGGVGLALGVPCTAGVMLIAIDLDVARDPSTGTFASWAIDILKRFAGSFMEASPSGNGVHIVATISANDHRAIKSRLRGKQRADWKRPAEAPGAKAPGFELLLGGFVTMTFNLLPNSAPTFRPASLDALNWLFEEAGPAFVQGAVTTPGQAAQQGAAANVPFKPPHVPPEGGAQAAPPSQKTRRFIANAGRMARFARYMDDRSFQIAAALAAVSRVSAPGRSRAGIHRNRLCALPGRDRGSSRGNATITAGFKRLIASFDFAVIERPVRQRGERRGRVTVWEFPAWWIKTAAPRDEQPSKVLMPNATWLAAVWTLSPRALRIWCYLIATHELERRDRAAGLTPSPGDLAEIFGGRSERAAAALDEIAAAGLFEVVEAKRPGRAAKYRRAAHA